MNVIGLGINIYIGGSKKYIKLKILDRALSQLLLTSGSCCLSGLYHLNARKHFFTVSLVEHWPREVVESSSLEIFET